MGRIKSNEGTLCKKAPSVNFIAGYNIRLGYDKSTAIFKYSEDYKGQYHLLYKKGGEGVKMGWRPVYKTIFKPNTGELTEEEVNPSEL
ncbi:hypothetical protein [Pseudoalteromonas spongiae]|uniref:hypothetical protein n=1 Tax=Pseudoalteromonas spongiae TaxID=298657 RepID=UPI00110A3B3F|nr:hypothetical protein [Pseudoalteromonas spongiae]TMO84823.1 hypothetical protein CWC15_09575 [Pseudoalteromonas spongiae]